MLQVYPVSAVALDVLGDVVYESGITHEYRATLADALALAQRELVGVLRARGCEARFT